MKIKLTTLQCENISIIASLFKTNLYGWGMVFGNILSI
jgi:hypothetical protein